MKPEDLAGAPPARLPFPITRALAPAIECRAAADPAAMPTMVGHFSTFNDWYEVDSWIEGHFLERVAPGAFRKTIAESRSQMKVLYDHGQDPTLGNQILGPIEKLAEDKIGPAYEVPLFDGVPPLLVSGLRAGVYGSSFRFSVEKDAWDQTPDASAHNPAGVPERTITEARVFEFGPVTFPANPAATAGVRSTTDAFYQRSRDPEAFETLLRSAQVARTPNVGAAIPPVEPPADTLEVPPPEPSRSDTPEAVVEPAAMAAIPEPQENRTVGYETREEKTSRVTELKDEQKSLASEYPGVMPEAVQSRWDAAVKEQDDLERDIAAWDARQARIKRNAEDAGLSEPVGQPAPFNIVRSRSDTEIHDVADIRKEAGGDPDRTAQLLRDNAMRSIERATFAHPRADQAGAKQGIANLLDKDATSEVALRLLATGTPTYRRAFQKLIVGLPLSPEESRAAALAATATGAVTTTTGGYAIPYTLDPTLVGIGAYTSTNPFRAACRTVAISTTEWRAITVTAVPAAFVAEKAASTEQGPTFGQPSYVPQRAHTFVTVDHEMLQDRPDIVSELSVLFQEGKDTLEENQFALGVGTTVYPEGMFLKGAYTVKETITDNTTAIADLYATEAALPLRHRPNAAWFLGRGAIRTIQGWETAMGVLFNGINYANAGNLAAPGAFGNTGLKLLGYPVWETPSAPVTFTSDDTIVGVLCDPKTYVIVDRIGMNVEIISNMVDAGTGFPTGQRGVYAYWRTTGRVLNVDGGRQINVN